MRITKEETAGWQAALRGMRNPLNSWDRSDSEFWPGGFTIGPKDLKLAQNLVKAGTEHGKFARMIQVWVDVEAPLYWWKEFDTYRAGVEKNSCSTMHKIMSRRLTVNDFEISEEYPEQNNWWNSTIQSLNYWISRYEKVDTNELKEWCFRSVVERLPSAYIQKRTVMMSYAALRNIYFQRRNHKLSEWREFCRWVESLSYAGELICIEKDKGAEE